MQSQIQSVYINPYNPPVFDAQLTPDNPLFQKSPFNIAILTIYGRWIYIFYGNEQKCSSFFATLSTIVNKLEISFGSLQRANLKSIKQFNSKGAVFTLYTLKRQNFMYICWTNAGHKVAIHQLTINTMIDFLHFQLSSCFTGKVNDILGQNQTYDPSINFGKGRSMQNLLHYAIQNGMYSLPILFDAAPILPLSNANRSAIASILRDHKEEGLQVSILLTTNHLISLSKRKGVEIEVKDILLFFNLLQTQSSLCKSQNWFPICLPGLESHSMLFCYLNYIAPNLIIIMIADESEIFPSLSQISKTIKRKMIEGGLIDKIISSVNKSLIQNPMLQRMNLAKHFVIKYRNPSQIIMSSGQYFGKQLNQGLISEEQFCIYRSIYAQLYQHLLTTKPGRKEVLHMQSIYSDCCVSHKMKKCQCKMLTQYLGGYYDEGAFTIFLIGSAMAELQDAKSIISSILSFIRQDDNSLFFTKYN